MPVMFVKDASHRVYGKLARAEHSMDFPKRKGDVPLAQVHAQQHMRVACVEAAIRKRKGLAYVMGLDLDLMKRAIAPGPWRSILRSIDPRSLDPQFHGSFRQKTNIVSRP
jgi:hypothetical protein